MSFKDYGELDVTKETTSEKELKKLKKKYGVEAEYAVNIRRKLLCLGIALIPTVITVMLYANILKLEFGQNLTLALPYYALFLIMATAIYSIIKKRRIKISILLLMFSIDVLILITSMIIGIMAPVSITVKRVFYITCIITFILIFPLCYEIDKLDKK